MIKAIFPLFLILVTQTACDRKTEWKPISEKDLLTADNETVTLLQTLATKACHCARIKGEKHFEPFPDQYWEPGMEPEKPSACWEDFAEKLRPYKFDLGPAAACGPGSDWSAIELGGKSVDIHFGFGTCSQEQAKAAMDEYERKSGKGGCG